MNPFPAHGRTNDQRAAEDLAAQAGRLLTDLRVSRVAPEDLGAFAEAEAQSVIIDRLAVARPDDLVFGEWDPDSRARLEADRVWFVDPLDGERSYVTEGRPDWAVHVALWEKYPGEVGGITACAIAMPAYGRVLTGRGATTYQPTSIIRGPRPGPLVPPREDERLRIAVSEAEPPAFAEELAGELDASLVRLGSGGGKTATVLEGECDAYIHTSGHHQWDSAATVGVVTQRGLHASSLDGSELVYNTEQIEFPDLLVCTQDVAETIIDVVRTYL
ncbi:MULTISPECIES: inositol monophosphatase family protein [Dietzia]|jgi:3'(2'), 5'-bisphosphate nucleotidase|uniref:Inositol monophosphatase family protein n=1 Tax=Dietzia maris TaxID=37915 RepID=A0ABT8GX91_9ACTN|nr:MULTISPECIES: inositol monophosphatase family protein [Dietzia]MBB0991745.1 inositol monophosphatase [Dietzia sp. SLG510A3-30A2]MBB0995477.1 inositol monophosphatase [Dietzia sp. SLG510A3-40A3]MBB1010560.1 inositol monophosphatase [Dietzia sp. SLG510A3-3B2-2]ODQ83756.1 inositol monophosphatase [Dietzia alimentaria]HBD21653.1 inositol monophosphatase [Dietzia sp.]